MVPALLDTSSLDATPQSPGSDSTLPLSPLGQGDTFSQARGTTRRYLITLVDPQSGNPLDPAAYSSSTGLRAFLWEGGDGPILSSPTVAWSDASAPSIVMEVDPTHLANLAIQPYPVRIEVDRSGVWQEAWDGWADVLYEPSSTTAPYAPGTYQEMLRKGGNAIKQLLTIESRAGFLEERAEAWLYLRQILLARYRPPGGNHSSQRYSTAYPGYWTSIDFPNAIIAGYLDSGKLILSDQVKEILARKALALLFDKQQDEGWRTQARREHRRADILASSLVAGIDLVGNGFPSITINCGVFNTRDI